MDIARAEHVVQHGSSSDGKVQLVPVLRPVRSPRHSVLRLGGIEGVGDCEIVERAEFKQPLSVLV
jgi:hypothetical protein